MSVLIKGMDMPEYKGNGTVPVLLKAVFKVYSNGSVELVLMEGKEHFPITEVPTPHGDLIDKTVLLQDLFDVDVEMSRDGYRPTISDAFDEVELAIAIVRAEV